MWHPHNIGLFPSEKESFSPQIFSFTRLEGDSFEGNLTEDSRIISNLLRTWPIIEQ
jgi:hypothetical protein